MKLFNTVNKLVRYGPIVFWACCVVFLLHVIDSLPRRHAHEEALLGSGTTTTAGDYFSTTAAAEQPLDKDNDDTDDALPRYNFQSSRKYMLEKYSMFDDEGDGEQRTLTDWEASMLFGVAKDKLLEQTDDVGVIPQWASPLEFIQSCDDLLGPFPEKHPSKLAPLFRARKKEYNTSRVMGTLADYLDKLEYSSIRGSTIPCLRYSLDNPQPPPPQKPRIGIVMVVNDTSSSLAQRSLQDKREYAAKHGYGLHIFGQLEPKRDIAWSKFPAMLAVAPLYEWIWAVDLDTIIMNPETRLESFIDPRYDIITSLDINGINLGSFFASTRNWTRMLLAVAWTKRYTKQAYWQFWHEQAAIMDLSEDFRLRDHMKFTTNRGFNGYVAGKWGNLWQPGDFLVHFPGLGDIKAKKFDDYWNVRNGGELPPPDEDEEEDEEERKKMEEALEANVAASMVIDEDYY